MVSMLPGWVPPQTLITNPSGLVFPFLEGGARAGALRSISRKASKMTRFARLNDSPRKLSKREQKARTDRSNHTGEYRRHFQGFSERTFPQ